MATTSLTTATVIEGDEKVNAFLDAIIASEKDKVKHHAFKPPGRLVRDSEELKRLMARKVRG